MDRYRVEYYKHSLIDELKRVAAEVSKAELIELLNNGMVTLNNAQRISEVDQMQEGGLDNGSA